jgi:2OG-Fe(II) oxygenase superfamily
MHELVQLCRSGALVNADAKAVENLQRQFVERHCILLARLIDPEILAVVLEQVSKAQFVARDIEHIGTETWIPSSVSACTLTFLANSQEFLRFIERVTSCDRIGDFFGRIYRMPPTEGHEFDWHDDTPLHDHRMLTLSLNLSTAAYEGGETQIREKASERILFKIANTGLGDAIVFRVSPALEHRVTPVRGTIPRTAFAGWFRSPIDGTRPDFHSAIREPHITES